MIRSMDIWNPEKAIKIPTFNAFIIHFLKNDKYFPLIWAISEAQWLSYDI